MSGNPKAIPLKVQGALAKYESARESLRAFENEHARVVEEHTMLRSSYNDAVENVVNEYRENHEVIGQRLGDFSLRYRREVDAGRLVELLGTSAVTDGYVKTELVVDRKAYDKGVNSGAIPVEIVAACEKDLSPAVLKPRKSE